jgi:hypothetical protein
MPNGGNARDRRRLRRIVATIVAEFTSAPSDKSALPGEVRPRWWEVLIRYIGLPGLILALTSFGYKLQVDGHLYFASALYLGALGLFLLALWIWLQGPKWRTVTRYALALVSVSIFVYLEYTWIRDDVTPTYVLFVPTPELVDVDRII